MLFLDISFPSLPKSAERDPTLRATLTAFNDFNCDSANAKKNGIAAAGPATKVGLFIIYSAVSLVSFALLHESLDLRFCGFLVVLAGEK